MKRRVVLAGGLLLAATAPAQAAVNIEHDGIGCIVAGQYPKFVARFTPTSELARARIYFRVAGTPHWYYVEMKAEAPDFAGILPKPKKDIKKINYYIEVVDKAFAEARTSEFAPDVVPDKGGCRKDKLVAPGLGKATVVVGAAAGAPAAPVGFFAAGALSTTTIVAGTVVAAGGAVAGASQLGGGDTTTTTLTTGSGGTTTTTQAPATTTTTTTTTTTLARANSAPHADLRTQPDPPSGSPPLPVEFNLCHSSDPDGDSLQYSFDFGDGTTSGGRCVDGHTYNLRSFDQAGLDQSFHAQGCVNDGQGHEACRSVTVTLLADVPLNCKADRSPPQVSLTSPVSSCFLPFPIQFRAPASDDFSGVAAVKYYVNLSTFFSAKQVQPAGPVLVGIGSNPPDFAFDWTEATALSQLGCNCFLADAYAVAQDNCGKTAQSQSVSIDFCTCATFSQSQQGCFAAQSAQSQAMAAPKGTRTPDLAVSLDIPGASGQVMLNGREVAFAGPGRSERRFALNGGENRVEAQLVEATGQGGTWRFDLNGLAEPGSVRVVAGEAVLITADAIVFRLKGSAGERVVFAFRGAR